MKLDDNQIGDAGLLALAKAAAQPGALQRLNTLTLGKNPLTEEGVGELALALEGGALPSLKELEKKLYALISPRC